MHEINTNGKLKGSNEDQMLNYQNDTFISQKQRWEEAQLLISKTIKEIFWKAWIKPLRFDNFENGILYLSSESKIISNRAETQYYDNIFLQASKIFEPLRKIKFSTIALNQKENVSNSENKYNVKIFKGSKLLDIRI